MMRNIFNFGFTEDDVSVRSGALVYLNVLIVLLLFLQAYVRIMDGEQNVLRLAHSDPRYARDLLQTQLGEHFTSLKAM